MKIKATIEKSAWWNDRFILIFRLIINTVLN
jgi:hypothetical protein